NNIDSKDKTANEIEFNNETASKDEEDKAENKTKIMDKVKCTAMKMLKAGTKPSMIYEALRDENGSPTVTRKDISNLGLRIDSLEETTSIETLIIEMEERQGQPNSNHIIQNEVLENLDSFFYLSCPSGTKQLPTVLE
ncbi:15801_t:CDS:2, partial [Racocetra fulgida]